MGIIQKTLTESERLAFAIPAAFLGLEVGRLWTAVKALSDTLVHFWFAYLRTVCLVGPRGLTTQNQNRRAILHGLMCYRLDRWPF